MLTSDRIELRLTLLNAAIFAAVLCTFAISVFIFVVDKQNQDNRADVRKLADAVIASIDFDEDQSRNPDSAEPDLICSAMPDTSAQLLSELKLQWFNYNQKLVAEKGTFTIVPPLQIHEGFQFQENPKGIIFSKPVLDNNRLLGYVRVAQPLAKQDRFVSNLLLGLSVGTIAALVLTGCGVFILVKQSILPLRKSMQMLRQFTSDASHELRTPVAAIQTNTAVALKYPEGMRAGDKDKFEMIGSAAKQMQTLVESLLKLGRAESIVSEKSTVNLARVVDDVYQRLLPSAEEGEIKLDCAVPPELHILANREDLLGIISNLLENAIRYTIPGGSVKIRATSDGQRTALIVEDTGIGIAEEHLERVFDRFWRADKARTFSEGGQGLGLTITKRLVEEHGGSITVESELGRGSTFKVLLNALDS